MKTSVEVHVAKLRCKLKAHYERLGGKEIDIKVRHCIKKSSVYC